MPRPVRPFLAGAVWEHDDPGLGHASGTATVLTYRQPVPGVYGPDGSVYGPDGRGEEWARLEVKVCTKSGGEVRVSQSPWSLAMPDGSRIQVTGDSGGDFPRPEFPMDAAVRPGDCARGGIMFPVPEGQRPERVIYEPDGGGGEASVAEWSVPRR